jgi:hypothetical protein
MKGGLAQKMILHALSTRSWCGQLDESARRG